jgi:hypothetical protein
MPDRKTVATGKTRLVVTAFGETTPPEEIQIYAHAVKFLAYWIEKQDGAAGCTTEDLFTELKTNVCKVMMGETKGTG